MFHWPNLISLVPWKTEADSGSNYLMCMRCHRHCDGDQLAPGDRHGEQPYLTQESPCSDVTDNLQDVKQAQGGKCGPRTTLGRSSICSAL